MAKKRYINTKFWSDDFIIGLDPIKRYFFLYLLTNEHTDICGIYELSKKVIQRETDLTQDEIEDCFRVLQTKIAYIDGWVYIKNFEKHQAVNPKVIEGIKRSKANVPESVLAKISEKDIDYDSLSKATIETELLTLKPTPTLKPIPLISEPSSQGNKDDINKIFDVFYNTINPALNYGNKTSRDAAKWMINKLGVDEAVWIAEYACSVHGQQYAPTITTPYQLKEKLSALKAYKDRQENETNQILDLSKIL